MENEIFNRFFIKIVPKKFSKVSNKNVVKKLLIYYFPSRWKIIYLIIFFTKILFLFEFIN